MVADSNDELQKIKIKAFQGTEGQNCLREQKRAYVTLRRNRFGPGLFLNCSHLLGFINYE